MFFVQSIISSVMLNISLAERLFTFFFYLF